MGERAIRIILPVATASGVDTISRAAEPALAKALGHPVVIDNQPGAGGIVGTTPIVIVVNPRVPAKNAQELIALLEAKPGVYNYGSSGNGAILHLAAEMFMDEAGRPDSSCNDTGRFAAFRRRHPS